MKSADNQQERLDGYIAGYVDGEGTFSIALSRAPTTQFGWQLIPEFHVSQNGDRSEVLRLIQMRFGCGYIKPNGRKDRAVVLVVRRRADLLGSVIPFFERVPLLSAKRIEFESFARVVRAMDAGESDPRRVSRTRRRQPGDERPRPLSTNQVVGGYWPSRILRDCTPDGSKSSRRYSPSCMATCRVRQKWPGPRLGRRE